MAESKGLFCKIRKINVWHVWTNPKGSLIRRGYEPFAAGLTFTIRIVSADLNRQKKSFSISDMHIPACVSGWSSSITGLSCPLMPSLLRWWADTTDRGQRGGDLFITSILTPTTPWWVLPLSSWKPECFAKQQTSGHIICHMEIDELSRQCNGELMKDTPNSTSRSP